MFIVICYDIPDDRRRNRLAKALKAFADRVQESVFEGNMEPPEIQRMIARALREINTEEDSLRIYRLCAGCKPQTLVYGCGSITEDPDVVVV